MGWLFLWDDDLGQGALGCDTADCVFGPLFYARLDRDKVQAFLIEKGVSRGDPRIAPKHLLEEIKDNERDFRAAPKPPEPQPGDFDPLAVDADWDSNEDIAYKVAEAAMAHERARRPDEEK